MVLDTAHILVIILGVGSLMGTPQQLQNPRRVVSPDYMVLIKQYLRRVLPHRVRERIKYGILPLRDGIDLLNG